MYKNANNLEQKEVIDLYATKPIGGGVKNQ